MQDYSSKLADHLAGAALQINIRTAAGCDLSSAGIYLESVKWKHPFAL